MTLLETSIAFAPVARYQPWSGAAEHLPVTDAQLHGWACIRCGSALPGLVPAGHVYPNEAHLGWAVVACPHHAGS